jgi:hypothetical protein
VVNTCNWDSKPLSPSDIRQSEGFKNVSLGNILSARDSSAPVSFLGKVPRAGEGRRATGG